METKLYSIPCLNLCFGPGWIEIEDVGTNACVGSISAALSCLEQRLAIEPNVCASWKKKNKTTISDRPAMHFCFAYAFNKSCCC